MENTTIENNVANTFTVNTISEFYNLPKNTLINVNGDNCKLLWDNGVWYGVQIGNEITDVERAMALLDIYRKTVRINNISDIDIINSCEPSDNAYTLTIENGNCTISFEFYRTFTNNGYLNNIIMYPLVCEIEIYKELDVADETYTENREFMFDVYGDQMLPKRHLIFPELEKSDINIIANIFQDIANIFGRKYVFHEYGKPVNIFEPKADK